MIRRIRSFLFENKTVKQTAAKNTVWLTISNFGGRALKAIIIIYSARVLGAAGYGVFSYAVALAGFFTLFLDPGVNSIVMREVPKEDEAGRLRVLATTLVLKIVLIAAMVAFVLFVAPSFSTLPGAVALLPIVALIITFDTTREFFSAFIRANEKMEWEAGIFLLTNLMILVTGFLFLFYSKTPLALGWAYVVGTALGAVTAVVILRKRLSHIFSHFSAALIRPILASAWPFAVTGALGILLTNTDILIISWMRSASEVGIYSAAIRIIQVLYVLPAIFQFSTLPVLARLANKDNERFRRVFEGTVGFIFLASVPLALGGAVLGTQVMALVFGTAYASGGWAFKLLMLTMIVDYPAAIISNAIFVYDRQKSLIIASLIGGVLNVGFDLLFIPRFGMAGSAFGTLLAQIAVNWYLWHMMKKINYFEVLPRLRKIAMAGVGMAAVTVALFIFNVNVILNIGISGVTYFLLLYFLREPLLAEMKSALGIHAAQAQPAA
jgi:O-antigen/teichoic acid export membrane protein